MTKWNHEALSSAPGAAGFFRRFDFIEWGRVVIAGGGSAAGQVCSVWIAFDHVDQSNGAMEFVAGSHRSGRRYQPFDFRHTDAVAMDEFEPLPDVDAHRNEFRIVTWDLEPGDAVVFSALTLHGAAGNDTWDRRRRALSIRYTGDDARFIRRKKMIRLVRDPGLRVGDRMDCELFPVAWPRPARATS